MLATSKTFLPLLQSLWTACALTLVRFPAGPKRDAMALLERSLRAAGDEEAARRSEWDGVIAEADNRGWNCCRHEVAGDVTCTDAAWEAWRLRRDAVTNDVSTEPRLRVWNGTGGRLAAARNWRMRAVFATLRGRLRLGTRAVTSLQPEHNTAMRWTTQSPGLDEGVIIVFPYEQH